MSGLGCATARPTAVRPEEIPELQAQLVSDPTDAEARHRYAAALFADDRCEEAVPAAEQAMAQEPDNVIGPLVVGRCLEADERYDEALEVYAAFRTDYPDASGSTAIQGQALLARQARAVQYARDAIAEVPGTTDPQAVAVLPLLLEGDSIYASLSRGLANAIVSDLDLLQRFRFVERVQINAILSELALGQTTAVDPQTLARAGQIIRAGRTVQGTVDLAVEEQTSLSAAVVTDQVGDPVTVSIPGRLEDLMDMEKELVFGISEAMGYTPTLAERRIIDENGTRNLLAFLAYSRGLDAESNNDYAAAALLYQEAVAEDPGFTQAEAQLEIVSAAEVVSTVDRSQVTTFAVQVEEAVAEATGQADVAVSAAMTSSILDVAALDSERITQAGGDVAGQELGTLTGITPPPLAGVAGVIRIVIIIP
jgi:tetratricopeptide (TPR) repeat protein